MAAPTWVKNQSSTSGAVATVTITATLPPALTVGNMLILAVAVYQSTAPQALSTPPGWTKLVDGNTAYGFNFTRAYVFAKVVASGEIDPVLTVSGAGGWIAQISEFAGVDVSPANIVVSAGTTSAGTSIATPAITTPGADNLVVWVEFQVASFNDISAGPSGSTLRVNVWDPSFGLNTSIADKAQATAATVAADSFTRSHTERVALAHSLALGAAVLLQSVPYEVFPYLDGKVVRQNDAEVFQAGESFPGGLETGKTPVVGAVALTGTGSLTIAAGTSYPTLIGSHSSLYAYYRMNEASGATIHDSKGSNDGTVTGGTLTYSQAGAISGDSDTSLLFSGDWVNLPFGLSGFWALGGSFTIEGWFLRPSDGVAGTKDEGIISAWRSSATGGPLLWTDFFNSGNYGLAHGGGSTYYLQSSSAPTIGGWDHLVVVFDRTVGSLGTVYLYVNAVAVASLAVSSVVGATTPEDVFSRSSGVIQLGTYADSSAETVYGRLDEVAFYSGALTPTEVGSHYAGRLGGGGPFVTHYGAAALAGTGSLSASGTVTHPAATVTGAANLGGSGALAATGAHVGIAVAALAGTGTLSATGTRVKLGAAALAGAGALSATGTRVKVGAAALTGAGTLAAAGTRTRTGSAALSGAGTLSATGTRIRSGAAALSGLGALTAAGTRTTAGSASLHGAGSLAAAGTRTAVASVALHGTGQLTASSTDTVTARGAAALSGTGSLTATAGALVKVAAATLTGSGTSTTAGTVKRSGAATLTGTGALAASGFRTRLAVSALAGTGTLAAAGYATRAGVVTLSGLGRLSAAGHKSVTSTATLAGSGTLHAAGAHIYTSSATLAGLGTLSADGVIPVLNGAVLSGLGSLSATGTRGGVGVVLLVGRGFLLADSYVNLPPGQISMTRPGLILVTGPPGIDYPDDGDLDGPRHGPIATVTR